MLRLDKGKGLYRVLWCPPQERMTTLGIHRNPTLINSKGEESSVAGGQFVTTHARVRVLTVTA